MKYPFDGKLLAAKKPFLRAASEGVFRHVPGLCRAGKSGFLDRLIKPTIEYL
jgi:hypothetical protein